MRTLSAMIIGCGLLATAVMVQAQTFPWMQTSAPGGAWTNIIMSADGRKLAVISGGSVFYTSTNFGASWISNSIFFRGNQYPLGGWTSIASSANGSNLWLTDFAANILVSTNAGATWAFPQSSPPISPASVAVSADGTKIVASGGGGICISTNSGQTFVQTYSNPSPAKQSVSGANGQAIIVNLGTDDYVSTNFGLTWSAVSQEEETRGGGVSADGNTMIQVRDAGIYVSTNRGAVFYPVLNEFFGMLPAVALSADGRQIFITGFNTNIVYSTNYGINWMTNHSSIYFHSIACSPDGNKLAACGSTVASGTNYVYVAYLQPSPQINAISTSNQLALSWTVPSTNMILQQSGDLNNWVAMTNPPALNLTNLQEQITLSTTNSAGFFRLISQ